MHNMVLAADMFWLWFRPLLSSWHLPYDVQLMTCPTCGRPEPEIRLGVCLPRIKANVFDAVKAASDIGITTRQLMRIIYGGKVKRSTATIRNHIQQINDMLAGTDWHISCRDRRHWLLDKREGRRT